MERAAGSKAGEARCRRGVANRSGTWHGGSSVVIGEGTGGRGRGPAGGIRPERARAAKTRIRAVEAGGT